MDTHYLAIIKWGVSIALAVFGWVYRAILWKKKKDELKTKDPKADFITYAFFEPFAFGLLIYCAAAITEIKFVNFSEVLDGRTEVNNLSKNLNKTYDAIGNNKILISIVDDKIKDLNRFTIYATNTDKNIIISNPSEFLSSAKKIFELADDNSTILATSYVNKNNWWYTIEGKEYLKKNYDFIKNKRGAIKRIHIFANQDEYDFYKDLMTEEKKNGIDVNYVFVNKIPRELNYNLKQDMIILGGEFAGRLELNEERVPQLVNYYASEDKIKELSNVFSNLQKYATEF